MERVTNQYSKIGDDEYVFVREKNENIKIDYFAEYKGRLTPVIDYDNGYGGYYVRFGKRERVSRDEFTTEDFLDILGDEMSAEELTYMGCSGAMERGVPYELALKQYKLTEEQYLKLKEKYRY